MRRSAYMAVILLLLFGAVAAGSAPGGPSGRTHRVFFPDTERELNVYEISGREPGPTLLIIGGIHGDEPGGYLAADLYADLTLKRGNLIVVPRANIYSIHKNERGSRGDMNRKFGAEPHEHELDAQIIGVLTDLMRRSDFLLNLHDGSGFYAPEWEDDLHNPMRWGQTVIIDTGTIVARDGSRLDLDALARTVVEQANREISETVHRFRVKNTRTFNDDSPFKEQRGSATFYAVSDAGIPAFGVETSKQIADEVKRVEYQVLVVNAFLERFGIEPDHPRFALETPRLRYVTVSVDGAPPVVVENGADLSVRPGSVVEITHVEANYERGLVVDLEGAGGFNDLGNPIVLERDTRVVVRKDKYHCGEIWIRMDPDSAPAVAVRLPEGSARSPNVDAFRIAVNGRWHYLPAGESLQIVRGDRLQLDDPLGPPDPDAIKVNLRGFVGNPVVNDGEDRGYTVHTERDLLQRFSLSPEKERYEIRVERGRQILGTSVIEVADPRLDYVLIRLDDGPLLAVAGGDTLSVAGTRRLRVEDLVTLPRETDRFTVNFRGFAGPNGAEDRGLAIDLGRNLLSRFSLMGKGRYYEITVRLGGFLLGRVVVDLGPAHPLNP